MSESAAESVADEGRRVAGLPVLGVFANSPDGGQGQARDMRVRWALEEVGQPYEVRPVSFTALKAPAHLARNPFGQIPTFEEGGLVLFESGAIVLHVAGRRGSLLPEEPDARARAVAWVFAALNTVEPPIVEREMAELLEGGEDWARARQALLDERVRVRLAELSARLGDAEWLEGGFSAGDLMMVTVLRRLSGDRLIEAQPNLAAYMARGEARPAFQRAFAAQRAFFEAAAPGG